MEILISFGIGVVVSSVVWFFVAQNNKRKAMIALGIDSWKDVLKLFNQKREGFGV